MRICFVPSREGRQWEVAGLGTAERTRRGLAALGLAANAARDHSEAEAGACLLLLAEDGLIEPGALRALTSHTAPAHIALAPANDVESPAALRVPGDTPMPRNADDLAELAAGFRARGKLQLVSTGAARCHRVSSELEASRVERQMLAALIQPTDGFLARHFDRHLSSRLSVILVRHGVHPNVITIIATLVGLLGAWFLSSAHAPVQILGSLLFIVSTVLDGCDGEVARLSLRRSELGRRLDLVGDNIVNVAVFVAIGYACFANDPSPFTGIAVGLTLFGLACATAAGLVYSTWLSQSGRKEALRDKYESLVSRDFAYWILGFVLFDRLSWFVWAAAIGANAFAALLVVLRLKEWPPKEPKPPELNQDKGDGEISTGDGPLRDQGGRVGSTIEDALGC